MRRVLTLILFTSLVLPAASAPAAQGGSGGASTDVAHVASGVKVAGIPLGGLDAVRAAARLRARLAPRLQTPLHLRASTKRVRLAPRAVRLRLDVSRVVSDALAARRGHRVAVHVLYDRGALHRFVERLAHGVYRRARNARFSFGVVRMHLRRSRTGRRLLHGATGRVLKRALASPAKRNYGVSVRSVRPRRTLVTYARLHPTIVTVQQSTFKLRLFKGLRLVRTYGVAVGMPAYPTPYGLFHVSDKQVNPAWTAPNSPWAGELGGTTTPGGSPQNPLKARWMGLADGVGIHGTGEDYSIGSRASHGCIRMHVSDVIALYPRVPTGTPVLIG